MGTKRPLGTFSLRNESKRRKSGDVNTYFHKTLHDSGLEVKRPPEKCLASKETTYIIRSLGKILKEHENYPSNVDEFLANFENACEDRKMFEHYLFPNIEGIDKDMNKYKRSDSVIKILLSVTILQNKLIEFIFDKIEDFVEHSDFEKWVKMILKSLSALHTIKDPESLAAKLILLINISSDSDVSVRLEIISAIPDIIGDQEHENVASEMCKIMSSNMELLPAILDCLTYLCLSDEQYKVLQEETLKKLYPTHAPYFPNFIKFLLMPNRLSDKEYEKTIESLRKQLGWISSISSQEEIATSQVLTAKAIRSAVLSNKVVAKATLNVLLNCKDSDDLVPIDIIFFLILYSISEEKEKQVEKIIIKQIKMQILKETFLDEAFKKYKPIFKDNLVNSMSLVNLANSLLKCNAEPLVQTFASHMYEVMFTELTDCSPILIANLLELVLNCKKSILNILNILNKIASENLLTQQSLQILTLLDRTDDMTLKEIRAVMNLICRLAFSFENSDIRNDVKIIIRKELSSSIPSIKVQGILAGIYAVKYLTNNGNCGNETVTEDEDDDDEITLSMTSRLPMGYLREAAETINLIKDSTEHNPDMVAFFYDELYKTIKEATDMNTSFISWLTKSLTNNWQMNFLVEKVKMQRFGEIQISSQYCWNQASEVDEEWSVNIAGLTLADNNNVHIETLAPLFQLVRGLHYKKDNDLSSIDALLGCSIVMPTNDADSIVQLSETAVSNVLDCYVHCVNWIRELLNAFATQNDVEKIFRPKILNRILDLKKLEKNIEDIILIKDITYKPPGYFSHAFNISIIREQVERRTHKSQVTKQKKGKKTEHDDTVLTETGKTQQTKKAIPVKNKVATIHNIHYRPLNLTLIELLKYDLTPYDNVDKKLTFEILQYLLKHLNGSLDKILISRIKKQTSLSKDTVEIYNRSEAEAQVKIISEILPNVISHMDFIVSFIQCHMIEDGIDRDNMYYSKVMEGCSCLEHIYNLLTIYFKWIEFKNKDTLILHNSLKVVGKVEEKETFSMVNLLKSFQGHEKYCTTLSFAVSLIDLMNALQDHSRESSSSSILKDMAYKFLSKPWDDDEKGLIYNQAIDTLIKVYLDKNTVKDLKDIITPLVKEVEKIHDKNNVLPTLKSINKNNFTLFFRNFGTALCNQIKAELNSDISNTEKVEVCGNVATILNLMSDIVTTLNMKYLLTAFFKKSIPIMNIFLSKGFPSLKKAFPEHRQAVLDVLKHYQVTTKYFHSMFLNSKSKRDRALMKKIPDMETILTKFDNKTRELLAANGCLEDSKQLNMRNGRGSRKESKRDSFNINNDEDFSDESDESSDFNESDYKGTSAAT